MKKIILPIILCVLYFVPVIVKGADKTVQSVTISQVDTFALRTMAGQPILKINIQVTGTTGTLTLQKLVINTTNEDNTDVDSVAVYSTGFYDRFSLADYPGEAYLLDKRKEIIGDSAVYNSLSHILETGDNYFWVTMDLNKYSRASHYIDAFIKANGIKIGDNYYPAAQEDPTGVVGIAEIYFKDNFESKTSQDEPVGWTQEQLDGSPVRWKNNTGGYGISVGTGHPSTAKSGIYNVMLQRQSYTTYKTVLVSKPIDLSLSNRPLISFYHAQVGWCKDQYCTVVDNDELRVLYKIGESGTWQELEKYQLATPNTWLKREVLFPEGVTGSNIYLGFEGTTKYGWGVCVDSLTIYETGIIPREVKEIKARNPILESLPQGSSLNPIMRINIRIKGNTGPINLNSIKVTSANTSDSDIKASGVKLFYTNDSLYLSPVQIGTSQTFSGGSVTFGSLGRVLETGDNYFWVTYDLTDNAVPGHRLDAIINSNDIGLSVPGTYPAANLDPSGNRIIQQTMFFDDFEGTHTWTRTGEFEIDVPLGYGGLSRGRPDPSSAYSGSNVLGTDLTSNGDYEPNITSAAAYTAESPLIDATYFKNLSLKFYRWLNIDNTDTASIEYKVDGTSIWIPIWKSDKKYIETEWSKQTYSNLTNLNRKKFNLRFKLGPTDGIDNYSGWNIDYLFFTADSIPFDAAVTEFTSPVSACGLKSTEHVKVKVANTGPKTLVNLPIKLSLDGGKTYITETIAGPILKDDTIDYSFTTPIDLSKPSNYNIIVKATYPGDNYPDNDSIVGSVVSFPTYSLPYRFGFEQDTTFWFSYGLNNSWFEGTPSGAKINVAGEGVKCWKTDESGYHNLYEKSYAQSPCFSFKDKELPMIDLKFNYITVNQMDGAVMEYSLDQGKTWVYAQEDSYPFAWNWYNDTVKTLKHKGWTGQTAGNLWIQGRQILPAAIANEDTVQFRFVFKTDSTTGSRYEGFAFDDIMLYDAPYDIGVSSINGISNPACQYENSPYLNVTIENYGYRRMRIGDTIILGAKVNGVLQAVDTFKLAAPLLKNQTVNYTFTKPVNFEANGNYTIKAFTMIENDKTFYGVSNNDTASFSFSVNPNPVTGLKDTIYTARLDTMVIKLVKDVQYDYLWHDSSTEDTIVAPDTGYYKVTVTNNITGCKTKDSTYVKALIPDVGVSQVVAPANNCGYSGLVKPMIKITNYGTDTLQTGRIIPIGIILDGGTPLSDQVTLTKKLEPDSSVTAQLSLDLDLSAIKMYDIKVYSDMPYDTTELNDTTITNFEIYGYPSLDIGPQTLVIKDTLYQFNIAGSYSSYTWSNDSITPTNTIKTSGWYKLTVTDTHNCPAKDSSYVLLKVRDLKPLELVSPVTVCENTELSEVVLRIFNAGSDTIRTTDTVYVSYQLNGGALVADTLLPASEVLPGNTIDITFKEKADLTTSGVYSFKTNVVSAPEPDFIPKNDTSTFVVKVHGLPKPNLGVDEPILALNYLLDPGIGYVSYKWQDGSTDSTYLITQTHRNLPNEQYQVTVTDINGCTDSTAKVFKILIVPDVSPIEIQLPSAACSLSKTEQIKVKIKNTGTVTIASDKIIKLKYQINDGAFSKTDTLQLSGFFNQNQTILHTFKQLADLSGSGLKRVKVFLSFTEDLQPDNDTLTANVQVFSVPEINLGPANDSLIVDLPYVLDPGSGYQSYAWNDGSTNQTYNVTTPGLYTVTVVNTDNCPGIDTVRVIEKLFDLGVSSLNIPAQSCELSANQDISVEVTNTGTESFTDKQFALEYVINGGVAKTESFQFTGSPGTKQMYTFAETADLSGVNVYQFNITLTMVEDEVAANNQYNANTIVLGYPIIDFGAVQDTVKTTTFPYVLDAGAFTTYKWQDGSDNRIFSAPSDGWYNVTVSNSYGCVGNDSVYLKNVTGIHEIDDHVKVSIYPNPVSDLLYIDLVLNKPEKISYQLISSSGKIIMNKELTGSMDYKEIIKAANLPKGLYYIRVYSKDWKLVEKIVIQ